MQTQLTIQPVILTATHHRDSQNRNALEWIIDYLKRNDIHHYRNDFNTEFSDENRDLIEMSITICFKSQHQLNIFVNKFNQVFPYIEIL